MIRLNLGQHQVELLVYFVAGNPGPLSSVEKMTFSNDSTSRISGANLPYSTRGTLPTGNKTMDICGGTTPGGHLSSVTKIAYSSDTSSRIPAMDLSASRYGGGATGNVTVYLCRSWFWNKLSKYHRTNLRIQLILHQLTQLQYPPHHTKLDMRCQETYLMVICLVVLPMIR